MYEVKRATFGGYNIYNNGSYVGHVKNEVDSNIKNLIPSATERSQIIFEIMDLENDSNSYEIDTEQNSDTGFNLSKISILIIIGFIAILFGGFSMYILVNSPIDLYM